MRREVQAEGTGQGAGWAGQAAKGQKTDSDSNSLGQAVEIKVQEKMPEDGACSRF